MSARTNVSRCCDAPHRWRGRLVPTVAGGVALVAGCQSQPPAPKTPPPFAPEASSSVFPAAEWTQAAPAAHGFSPDGIDRAVAYAKAQGSTSGMIVHDGAAIAQWGDVARKSNLHSARKSFLSALVGIAVARGQMRLDDTLAQLGIDDTAPALSTAEKQATVRMLLQARSGVYHAATYETVPMKALRPPRGSHPPGTFWYYNNWDFNTVGAIYERSTGTHVFDALFTEIAIPVGMQDYTPSDGHYVSGGSATRYPAYPFAMSARDLARFALLYLHDGRWRDRQVVPADWVAESTRPYSDTRTGGYGYLWWTSDSASGARGRDALLSRRAFWADGYLGQYAVVVPSLDLAIVSLVDARLTSKRMGETKMETLVTLVEAARAQVAANAAKAG
ncbi:serine hydrolase domain-containing protein [Burkholderia contaminans]|uniref:serine hydrolase domain-containing protein n=2 Tax=Burkholderia contaminans TaxID=488447 RepID=UPI002417F404|nr:serine hydrolase [Burkholderia contaminans]WFN15142.1 beta-lactamase family protein [Burkholderia contaminans]